MTLPYFSGPVLIRVSSNDPVAGLQGLNDLANAMGEVLCVFINANQGQAWQHRPKNDYELPYPRAYALHTSSPEMHQDSFHSSNSGMDE